MGEGGGIGEVEEFGAEFGVGSLGDGGVLDEGYVEVAVGGAADGVAAGVAEGELGGGGEGGGVEELGRGLRVVAVELGVGDEVGALQREAGVGKMVLVAWVTVTGMPD